MSTFCGLGMSVVMLSSLGVAAEAQQATVRGMVIGRNGPTMYVKTEGTPRQIVVLSDSTKATEKGGFLGMSHKNLGVAELVPGLEVKVDGSYDQDHQLVAKKIEFSRNSLKTARQIDAGLNPVNEQVAKAQDALRSDRRDIESSQQDIESGKQAIAANGQAIGQAKEAIGQTNTRVSQTNTRIGELDQYETKGEMAVNFANGRATVKKKDRDQLEEFVKSAANTPGFMIQVQGYASAVGSAVRNQRLSSERAEAVLSIIQQSGAVPMTRILAPAAMGTTNQVADNHTRAGQAQNRRVVVTILVNKGITASEGQQAQTQPSGL
ncbi:MAG TPA: OmpA family protein [Acidobacteriaceae bacterium]|nr:OmpA family protein [Acidobacteriaceae bacterium]